MPEPGIVTGGGVADAYAQTAAGLALTASPLWINFLYTVNIIAAAVAAICGAIIGVAGVWRIIRRRGAIMSASETPDPADTLARTIWGEARGEGAAGMAAVAAVVMNRVRIAEAHGGCYWWGRDAQGVCRAQAQFSCWNPGDPNRAKLLAVDDADAAFRLAQGIAADALAGRLQDPTLGATSYKVASLPWPHDWGPPRQPLIVIGKHAFYNLTED